MAEVYRAEVAGPEGFVKEVALKVVRGDHAEGSDFVRMFIQEARLASRLAHANIVHVFDFARIEGRYCIAMEFVHGRTLGAVVERCRQRGARLGVPRAVFVAAEVAKALAYAHRPPEAGGVAGLVHRDVSPHNVLISFEGEVKLADFGIARAMNAAGLTDPGTVKGKLSYMAPEQARGERVDARADLFSLGVVLWELLAGRRLFARDADAATMAAVLSGDPISPPSAWNEEVPPDLDAAVMGLLERDAERRTRTADELGSALGAVLLRLARSPEDLALGPLMRRLWPEEATPPSARAGEPTAVRPPEPPLSPPGRGLPRPWPAARGEGRDPVHERAAGEAEVDPEASTETLPPPPRRARTVLALAVAVALGSAGVAAWRAMETRRAGAPVEPADAAGSDQVASDARAGAPTAGPPPGEAAALADQAPGAAPASAGAAKAEPGAPGPAEEGDGRPRVAASSSRLRSLPLPDPGSGEGILSLNATPWARVYLGGQRLGDTPLEVRIPAGRYAVRLVHPTLGSALKTVEVQPGRRATWSPTLGR